MKKSQLKRLRKVAKDGYIIHLIESGDEWLMDGDEEYIFLGRGRATDWGEKKEEGWEPFDGIQYDAAIEYPDGHGTMSVGAGFIMKAREVSNPVDEFPGWEDDFEPIGAGFRFKRIY